MKGDSISAELRQTDTVVPWKQVARMSNVLIHDYLWMNSNQVRQVAEQIFSVLKSLVITLLQEES